MTKLLVSMLVCFAIGFSVTTVFAAAHAVPVPAAAAAAAPAPEGHDSIVVAATTGSAAPAVTVVMSRPADAAASPLAAYDELRSAQRFGWGAVLFYCAWQFALLVGKLGGAVPWLAKLKHGRYAVGVGALAALSAAGFNAIALGGTLVAAFVAAFVAALTYANSNQDTKLQPVPF